MITFGPMIGGVMRVYVDSILSGHIKKVEGGWRYTAKGTKHHGDIFNTIEECKTSLIG